MLKQRHQFFVLLLCLSDALVMTSACIVAWWVCRMWVEGMPPGDGAGWIWEPLTAFVVPLGMVAMWGMGLYRPRRDRGFTTEALQLLKVSAVTCISVIVVLWLRSGTQGTAGGDRVQLWGATVDGSRLELILLAMALPTMLVGARATFRIGLRAIRRRGWNLRHVAIIGTGRLGRIACRTFDRNGWTGIHVAYFISHHDQSSIQRCVDRPVHGGLKALEEILDRYKPDAIYLALPTARSGLTPALLQRLERFAVDVRIIPDVPTKYVPQSMGVHELDGMPILSVRECPSEHGLGGLCKRCLDMVGAVVGLAIFAPLMLVIAAAIRMTSAGPVIFKQRRVSLGGEQFEIYKFRTMLHVEDEQPAAAWTSRHDSRITGLGSWLRRTSLDELPQLFNVLMGDMSLVGPRPERPELITKFREDWRGYMLRQHVKAGMTGWAQVNGLRGDTSLKKRLQLDLFYVRHWSLGFDLKILWLTFFRGFSHPNAH